MPSAKLAPGHSRPGATGSLPNGGNVEPDQQHVRPRAPWVGSKRRRFGEPNAEHDRRTGVRHPHREDVRTTASGDVARRIGIGLCGKSDPADSENGCQQAASENGAPRYRHALTVFPHHRGDGNRLPGDEGLNPGRHDEHRARRMLQKRIRDAPMERARDRAPAVHADNEHLRIDVSCKAVDLLDDRAVSVLDVADDAVLAGDCDNLVQGRVEVLVDDPPQVANYLRVAEVRVRRDLDVLDRDRGEGGLEPVGEVDGPQGCLCGGRRAVGGEDDRPGQLGHDATRSVAAAAAR